MNSQVKLAISQLIKGFPKARVTATDSGDGGAKVMIDSVDLGPSFEPSSSWVKFSVSFQYPNADIYPIFLRSDLTRTDGRSHGKGIAQSEFDGAPALQLSRRSNRLNPDTDTAALKVTKVLEWLRTQ